MGLKIPRGLPVSVRFSFSAPSNERIDGFPPVLSFFCICILNLNLPMLPRQFLCILAPIVPTTPCYALYLLACMEITSLSLWGLSAPHHHKPLWIINMNKSELVSKIAEASNITKAAAKKTLNSTLDVITKTLTNDENISLIGFGSFSVTQRAARTGRNPQTGKEIKISEKKVVKFKPGQKLKDSICVKVKTKGGCGCKATNTKKK